MPNFLLQKLKIHKRVFIFMFANGKSLNLIYSCWKILLKFKKQAKAIADLTKFCFLCVYNTRSSGNDVVKFFAFGVLFGKN